MEVLQYGTILVSFILSIIGLALAIWGIALSFYLKHDWAERVEEVDATAQEMEHKIELMKDTMEKLHKLHVQRIEDLEPLLQRLAVLETKYVAVSANQQKRQF